MSDERLAGQEKDCFLESIYHYMGCEYLSDLYRDDYRGIALKLALETDNGSYPLHEWTECLSYILRTKICADSVEETKQKSLEYAKQNHIL